MKVLFDNSVLQDAVRAHHGFEYRKREGFGFANRLIRPVTRTRPLRRDWRQKEIDSLPVIAELIHRGIVSPFTTHELKAEAYSVVEFPPVRRDDVFAGVEFAYLKSPLDRSKWGLSSAQYLDRESVIKYCEYFFLSPSKDRLETFIDGMRHNPTYSLTKFEERCLRHVSTFRNICRNIDRAHYPDALHLWTAEENGIDVFLSVDKKFRNVMERQNVHLHCKILFPSELLSMTNGS